MEGAVLAGEALADDLGAFVNEMDIYGASFAAIARFVLPIVRGDSTADRQAKQPSQRQRTGREEYPQANSQTGVCAGGCILTSRTMNVTGNIISAVRTT